MSFLNGIYQGTDATVSGEDPAFFTSLTCDTFQGVDGEYFEGITSNIQDQIDSIVVGGLTNTTGYFSLIATAPNGFVLTNTYTWLWSGGAASNGAAPISHNFPFTITSVFITFGSAITTAGTIVIEKNGSTIYTMSSITGQRRTTVSLSYAATDTLNIRTTAGAGGAVARITLSCEYAVYGQTPVFSIGSVSTSGSTAAVSQTGTSTAPVLNFNFVDPATTPAVIALINETQNITASAAYTEVAGVLNVVNPGPVSIQNNGVSLDDFYANKGDTQADINSLNASVSSLNSLVSGLSGTVAGIGATVGGLSADLASTDATVAGLSADVLGLDATVSGLSGDVATLQGDVSVIQDQVQNITATPAETNIYGQVITDSVSLNSINAKITNLAINAPTGDILVDANTIQLDATYTDVFGTLRTSAIGSTTGISVSASTTASISAPSITLSTPSGLGSVNLGNFTDVVYINGFPFQSYLWTQW
jgi:hypothetical protein